MYSFFDKLVIIEIKKASLYEQEGPIFDNIIRGLDEIERSTKKVTS